MTNKRLPEPEPISPINLPRIGSQICYSLRQATQILNWDTLRLKGSIASLRILSSRYESNSLYLKSALDAMISRVEEELKETISHKRTMITDRFNQLKRNQIK